VVVPVLQLGCTRGVHFLTSCQGQVLPATFCLADFTAALLRLCLMLILLLLQVVYAWQLAALAVAAGPCPVPRPQR
jgi:hypothetical protein